MIKIAICDDEAHARTYLTALIEAQNTPCEITQYASADDYVSDRAEHDLLFLDIALNPSVQGKSGMELAKQIRDNSQITQPVIIFVTGYEQYVYDAFDVNAFQYLIKPIDEQKFAEVFARAVGQILAGTQQNKKTLVIRHGGVEKSLLPDNIYYMESRSHKVVIHKKDGQLECYAKIGDLEEALQGQFFRIHKGFLINLSYVEEYSRTQVILANGAKLPVSKYKYEAFVKAHLRHLQ